MSAAPIEATVVVVEDATIEVDKHLVHSDPVMGDVYDYALKMTGTWTDAESREYPVSVEIPVYYPESTEANEVLSTVTVGSWDEGANWLGFGEGFLTVTTVEGVVTAKGLIENPMAGIAIDITISGKLETTALENIEVGTAATKVIKNGQLFIIRGEVEYNAQGQMVK
jgi:hypothetical protein